MTTHLLLTDQKTPKSGNFQLRLKYLKIEMHSNNMILKRENIDDSTN